MTDEQNRFFHLLDELRNANQLLTDGFGALQEIDRDKDSYHIPHQLIASGLERLMKCFIAVVHHGKNGEFPNIEFFSNNKLGHNLENLKTKICQDYYGGRDRPYVDAEYQFLMTDQYLKDAINILTRFGKFGRYYNINVIAGSTKKTY